MRQERLHRVRYEGLGWARHLHQGQDRAVGFYAGCGRDAEQDICLLHTDGAVSGLEERLPAHDAGWNPHQLYRGEETAHAAHLWPARLPPPLAGERATVSTQHAQLPVQEVARRAIPQNGRGRRVRSAQRGAASRRQLQAVVAPAAEYQFAGAAAQAARAADDASAGHARAAGDRGA